MDGKGIFSPINGSGAGLLLYPEPVGNLDQLFDQMEKSAAQIGNSQ